MTDPDAQDPLPRALQGDTVATGLLWRQHRAWVAAILLAHKPGGVELEDLLQDVALTMVTRLHTLNNPDALRPWLRSIAVNAARTAARRWQVRRRVLRPLVAGIDDPLDPAGERQALEEGSRDRWARVLHDPGGMHPDYREPLLLRAVEGMSQRDIAATLGLPVTTVETRLSRGRRMLRNALAPEGVARRRAQGR